MTKIYDLPNTKNLTCNLKNTGGTTMWKETELTGIIYRCSCGNTDISGSTRKLYCYKCGVWWDRDKIFHSLPKVK